MLCCLMTGAQLSGISQSLDMQSSPCHQIQVILEAFELFGYSRRLAFHDMEIDWQEEFDIA